MISIIVPVYNTAQYLPRCIDSILAQTYTNLEIILVNDGSTDNSGHICDEYSMRDTKIKVIHKANGGLSSARNAGLDTANGLWVGFVDSDDWILPVMYEQLMDSANSYNADMVICGYVYVNEQGETLNEDNFDLDATYSRDETFYNLVTSKTALYTIAPNKLYKKHILDDLRYPDGRLHEDDFLIHHIIGKCNIITTLTNAMYVYMQRSDSTMNKPYSEKRLHGAWDAFYDRYVFFQNLGMNKNARYTKRTLGGIVRTGMKHLDKNTYKNEIQPLYQKALGLLIHSLDLRAVKLFLCWHKWRWFT